MGSFCKKIRIAGHLLSALAVTSLHAQTPAASERFIIAVFPALTTFSHAQPGPPQKNEPDSLLEKCGPQITTALVSAFAEQPGLEVLASEAVAEFLRARPAYDPFATDSVRMLCRALRLDKLVLPVIEVVAADDSQQRWRLLLRWLDAASGTSTRLHAAEFEVEWESPGASVKLVGFDARAMAKSILAAPEIIFQPQSQAAVLPDLQALPPAQQVRAKSRRWLWYLGAAALGGGYAYFIWGRDKENEGSGQPLPEPPGPPPQ